MPLISPTIYWLSVKDYALNNLVLQVKQCRSSQTSELIKTTMREMLENWNVWH